ENRQVLKVTCKLSDRLNLEITESAVIREGEETSHVFQRLRQAGMKVAIDDFGTGYSSLSYLAQFPIDVIKIDKAFLRASGRGAKNSALLRAIVGLGHSLGVEIVAEGIESQQQATGQYDRSLDAEPRADPLDQAGQGSPRPVDHRRSSPVRCGGLEHDRRQGRPAARFAASVEPARQLGRVTSAGAGQQPYAQP